MSLPIRPLPILERYDCHGCGDCCFGTIVPLSAEDLARIRGQGWDRHPDYRRLKLLVGEGLFKRRYQLAKRPDGSCVFLTPQRRCRIHEEFGPAAKPLVCQIAPLQLVPLEQFAYLTVRRYCRSAANDHGRPLAEHCDELRDLVERNGAAPRASQPPPVARGQRRPWKETFVVTDCITRLVTDSRYPLIRRLVHGVEFCGLVDRCRLQGLDGPRLAELVGMLEEAAVEGAGDLFQRRLPPGKQAMRLFRQSALEYLRLHPKFVPERSWRERWRLVRAAMAFARGKGPVPLFRLPFPESTFESLERPLGHLDESVLRPLNTYFETIVTSLRYAVLGRRGWSVVDSFQSLALSCAVAMWILRLACGPRTPSVDDTKELAMLLDRGQEYKPLLGRWHRFRVAILARRRELGRLAVWYAR